VYTIYEVPSIVIKLIIDNRSLEMDYLQELYPISQTDRQTDRQIIQTYTYSTSSQHKLYNEICHVYLHICEIKNEQITVSLTVTIEKKNI